MEEYGYHMVGEMLIGLGKSLQDKNSDIRKKFKLSREQVMTLIGVIKLAASPDVQKKYIWDLADRWGVTEKTVRNWIDMGLVRGGRKTKHDTRHSWSADEIDEDERRLIRMGYYKPKRYHRVNYLSAMIDGFLQGGR